jgi:hypothetical protein
MGCFVIYFRLRLVGLIWTSPSQRPLPTQDNTTYKHKNTHAPSGIRTRDPSNQVAKTYASDGVVTGIGFTWEYQPYNYVVSFQVLVAASMKITTFWYNVPCSLAEVDWRFRGYYCLHLQGETSRRNIPRDCHLCQWALYFFDYAPLYQQK